MARYHTTGNYFPNQVVLWRSNVERAIRGTRGQEALREFRDALLGLEEKRLIKGALCTVNPRSRNLPTDLSEFGGEGVCPIGAYVLHQDVKSGTDVTDVINSLPTLNSTIEDSVSLAEDYGLTKTLAWELVYRADEYWGNQTPEQRYNSFLEWTNSVLV